MDVSRLTLRHSQSLWTSIGEAKNMKSCCLRGWACSSLRSLHLILSVLNHEILNDISTKASLSYDGMVWQVREMEKEPCWRRIRNVLEVKRMWHRWIDWSLKLKVWCPLLLYLKNQSAKQLGNGSYSWQWVEVTRLIPLFLLNINVLYLLKTYFCILNTANNIGQNKLHSSYCASLTTQSPWSNWLHSNLIIYTSPFYSLYYIYSCKPGNVNISLCRISITLCFYPSEGGSPLTKSRAIWDHGWQGTGRGSSWPVRGWRLILLQEQTG